MAIGNGGNQDSHGPGYIPVNKWGGNADVDTADAALGQIIWPIKAGTQPYLFLDSPIELFLKSTSANDDVDSGTGARTVKIMPHDSNGEEQEIIKDLQGTANQSIGLSVGVFRMNIETSGSSDTNEGQIQIVDGSANIYATIEIGEGQTQIAVVRCPNNKNGLIKEHDIEFGRISPSTNEATTRLRIRKVDGTIITKWDPFLSSNHIEDKRDYKIGGLDLLPGEWIYWEAIIVSANNTPLRASIDAEFIDS